LLKISSSILNRDLLERSRVIASILFKQTIAQLILLTITILKITFLQKRFVFEIEISSSSLSISSLIDNLVINQSTNFVLFKLRNFYINSSTRKKFAKAKQKTTCNIAFDCLEISNIERTFNKILQVIVLRLRETLSL